MGVVTDPIADMLTRIRNSCMARAISVDIPVSNMKKTIANILHREGYVRGYQLVNRGRDLRLRLRYNEHNKSILAGCKRISTPGRRVYVGKDDLPYVLEGIGVAIVSTSQGVMTATEARQRNIGGEVLCTIW